MRLNPKGVSQLKVLTALQSLYWQKEDLHDDAWRIERKIESFRRRGKNASNLLSKYFGIIKQIASIELQMTAMEGSLA